jgi:hypothetical protein
MPGGAPPKPDPLRRNKRPDDYWVDLPPANPAPAPKPPTGSAFNAHGKRLWLMYWGTPMSTQWRDAETVQLVRLIQLDQRWSSDRDVRVLPEMRQLETALGLTPKARKELRWRIVEDGAVVEENGQALAEPRRLRVVDDQAAV